MSFGPRSAFEIIGHNRIVGCRLGQMNMGVDTTRQDQQPTGVDLSGSALDPLTDGNNAPVPDADIGAVAVGRSDNRAAPYRKVNFRHDALPRCEPDQTALSANDLKSASISPALCRRSAFWMA